MKNFKIVKFINVFFLILDFYHSQNLPMFSPSDNFKYTLRSLIHVELRYAIRYVSNFLFLQIAIQVSHPQY
jgi:hypothetical protein